MVMMKMSSSAILSIDFDPLQNHLDVLYKNESLYRYYDIQPEIVEALNQAASKGRFINETIKPNYRCQRIYK